MLTQRRSAWPFFEERIKHCFDKVSDEHNKRSFIDRLYVSHNESIFEKTTNSNSILLRFGAHSTGVGKEEFSPTGELKRSSAVIEEGGALQYTQIINGFVICVIHAPKSELRESKRSHFIYKVYKSPDDITRSEIISAIELFYWFVLKTSYSAPFSLLTTLKVDYYRIRSFTYTPDWNAVMGIIGVVATVVSATIAFLK